MHDGVQRVSSKAPQKLRQWLLRGLTVPQGPHGESEETHAWWKAMCLTGVDYFSTLGYQPGIAFLAAGALSPIATLILVLVTLFAAYPVYSRVAEQSPNGQGSISMLERLFPNWTGKVFVLCLLGFAATDFIITITLSAADGTAHLIRNPFVPQWLHHQEGLTLLLLALLGAIFLKGFKEAIGIAGFLVAIYLTLNLVVVSVAVVEVLKHPQVITGWKQQLSHHHGSLWLMLAVSVIIFPKLALWLYGMATDWARASRPLVLVFVAISFLVTLIFHASVDAQAGAYATGVLVVMSSAAIAVTISVWTSWMRWGFLLISLVFAYTTFSNIVQRPEGIKIAAIFIGLIIVSSLVSRAFRSTELRIREIVLDDASREFLLRDHDQVIRLISHRPVHRSVEEYESQDALARMAHNLRSNEQLLFLEIHRVDSSDFEASLRVTGICVGRYRILRASSPAVPNAIAAILIHIRDITGRLPHVYFNWTEGNPIGHMFRFLIFGEGDVPPVTHEVLRHSIADPQQRPFVHLT